jgi:hypothetical protein
LNATGLVGGGFPYLAIHLIQLACIPINIHLPFTAAVRFLQNWVLSGM